MALSGTLASTVTKVIDGVAQPVLTMPHEYHRVGEIVWRDGQVTARVYSYLTEQDFRDGVAPQIGPPLELGGDFVKAPDVAETEVLVIGKANYAELEQVAE